MPGLGIRRYLGSTMADRGARYIKSVGSSVDWKMDQLIDCLIVRLFQAESRQDKVEKEKSKEAWTVDEFFQFPIRSAFSRAHEIFHG